MEAKSKATVMSDEEICARWGAHPTTGDISIYRSIAQVQAEISFKEGEKVGYDKASIELPPKYFQAGTREVIRWILDHKFIFPAGVFPEWQAKLKEWQD